MAAEINHYQHYTQQLDAARSCFRIPETIRQTLEFQNNIPVIPGYRCRVHESQEPEDRADRKNRFFVVGDTAFLVSFQLSDNPKNYVDQIRYDQRPRPLDLSHASAEIIDRVAAAAIGVVQGAHEAGIDLTTALTSQKQSFSYSRFLDEIQASMESLIPQSLSQTTRRSRNPTLKSILQTVLPKIQSPSLSIWQDTLWGDISLAAARVAERPNGRILEIARVGNCAVAVEDSHPDVYRVPLQSTRSYRTYSLYPERKARQNIFTFEYHTYDDTSHRKVNNALRYGEYPYNEQAVALVAGPAASDIWSGCLPPYSFQKPRVSNQYLLNRINRENESNMFVELRPFNDGYIPKYMKDLALQRRTANTGRPAGEL
jgi:hypothetical protein